MRRADLSMVGKELARRHPSCRSQTAPLLVCTSICVELNIELNSTWFCSVVVVSSPRSRRNWDPGMMPQSDSSGAGPHLNLGDHRQETLPQRTPLPLFNLFKFTISSFMFYYCIVQPLVHCHHQTITFFQLFLQYSVKLLCDTVGKNGL